MKIHNVDNLRTPTSEEARELGRRGGVASGKARREKKTMRETMNLLLDLPVKSDEFRKELEKVGITKKDQVNKMAVAFGLMKRAITGEPQAVKLLIEITGEVLDQQSEDLESIDVNINQIAKEDIERVEKLKQGLFKNES